MSREFCDVAMVVIHRLLTRPGPRTNTRSTFLQIFMKDYWLTVAMALSCPVSPSGGQSAVMAKPTLSNCVQMLVGQILNR
jgi:hypothetical protein